MSPSSPGSRGVIPYGVEGVAGREVDGLQHPQQRHPAQHQLPAAFARSVLLRSSDVVVHHATPCASARPPPETSGAPYSVPPSGGRIGSTP